MVNNSSARYYRKTNKKVPKQARKTYRSLSAEEKKQQYGHERYRNLPEYQKQRLVEFEKNIKCGKIKTLHNKRCSNDSGLIFYFAQQSYIFFSEAVNDFYFVVKKYKRYFSFGKNGFFEKAPEILQFN